jgi:hypothetical protein
MLHAALVSLVLFVFADHGYRETPATRGLAELTASAVEERRVPATGESHAVDASLLALYEILESGLDPDAVAYDPRAPGGQSCGLLQMRCPYVWCHTIREQLRWWLATVHAVGLAAVDSSSPRAHERLETARALVHRHLLRLAP